MTRLPDWPARFHAFVDATKRRPHAYGSFDCWLGFSTGAILAITGEDLTERYRGRYRSARGALRVIREDGHRDLADLAGSHLPEIAVSGARLGDLAAVPDGSSFGYALGIVNGERLLVLREDGHGTVGLLKATRAFRIG